MTAWLRRLRAEGEDWLRYNRFLRNRLGAWKLLRDAAAPPRDAQAAARAVRDLCVAARLTSRRGTLERSLARIRRRMAGLDVAGVDWSEFVPGLGERRLEMTELLKAPGKGEKGVLFVAFESQWALLLKYCDLRELARRYTLVLAPSSSPPYNLVNYAFPAAFPGKLFTLISNKQDLEALPRVAANFVPVPLFASSWVLPDLFRPRPRGDRDIDLVMVANFAKFKRHHALLGALRRMPTSLRVHLIGQDQDGRTADTIRGLARAYGVEGRFSLASNQGYEQVADALCRARASAILSRREGSCVVVAESLFADTPVALLDGAEIGSAAFINPATGRFLPGRDLAAELTAFIAESGRYGPRAWAEGNIDCFRSSELLNDLLRRHALEDGQAWTRDIEPQCWRPFPRLAREENRARLRPARQEFAARFGLAVGPPEGDEK